MQLKREHLLRWQWGLYPEGHRQRRNLLLHLATVPLFMAGTLAVAAAPWLGGWLALAGLAAMVAVVAVQGRSHRLEAARPVPFEGPADVATRLFVEQWVTFPRYVLSGGWSRAFRAGG